MCICNVYIPDSYELNNQELPDLIAQFPKPDIIRGDFDSRNTLWGCKKTDTRGKLIEKILLNYDVTLLNLTEPTHFNIAHATFSALDLSFCRPSIFDRLKWSVGTDLYNSDHFPISIILDNDQIENPILQRRWKFKKADGQKYQEFIEKNINILENPETAEAEKLTNS